MIDNYQILMQKVKSKKLDNNELFLLDESVHDLPQDVQV